MYNRYIRNDQGTYTRIPEETAPPSRGEQPSHREGGGSSPAESHQHTAQSSHHQEHQQEPHHQEQRPHTGPPPSGGRPSDGLTGFLRHFLDQLHLDHVDTGDLLLLGLLFFLFREDADEELLVALGLLLIL